MHAWTDRHMHRLFLKDNSFNKVSTPYLKQVFMKKKCTISRLTGIIDEEGCWIRGSENTQDQLATPRPKVGDSGFLFRGWIPCALFFLDCVFARGCHREVPPRCDSILSLPLSLQVSGGLRWRRGCQGGHRARAVGCVLGLAGGAQTLSDPRASITRTAPRLGCNPVHAARPCDRSLGSIALQTVLLGQAAAPGWVRPQRDVCWCLVEG